MPLGSLSPVMSAALTIAPAVVYSPIAPSMVDRGLLRTNRSAPEIGDANRIGQSRDQRGLIRTPAVVYSLTVPAVPFTTNMSSPATAIPLWVVSPVTSEVLAVAPPLLAVAAFDNVPVAAELTSRGRCK